MHTRRSALLLSMDVTAAAVAVTQIDDDLPELGSLDFSDTVIYVVIAVLTVVMPSLL